MKSAIRVLKLGGSLLESSDWVEKFINWYTTLPPARTLLLVGGGPPVDAIRQMASLRSYESELLHWLCIDAMEISYRLVESQLSGSFSTWGLRGCGQSIRKRSELESWMSTAKEELTLVHVKAFYTSTNFRQLPIQLPLGWETTSDSLAALLAHIVSADELILIKSCKVTQPIDWRTASQTGIVDAAFAEAAQGLACVRLVELNSSM